ncbi:elongation factor G-binding protein [Bacillus carboniphilus]|uniref:Elongation factor G-binding protein n=1 Tax=Bacillus carboniphilus TaxID=86663 RepID=A0ABP3GEB3_9BACI
MEPFIQSYEFNFIKNQANILVNGHSTSSDVRVLNALRTLTKERVINLFPNITEEQREELERFESIKERMDADEFLFLIKPLVIPFQDVSEQTLKKLFPKAKKLKLPNLEEIDWKETTYLGWYDKGSGRKYIVTNYQDKLIGLHGTFKASSQKGICTLCNKHEEVGLFVSQTKGSTLDTFVRRGNYICQDSTKCNKNIESLEKLHDLIERLNS